MSSLCSDPSPKNPISAQTPYRQNQVSAQAPSPQCPVSIQTPSLQCPVLLTFRFPRVRSLLRPRFVGPSLSNEMKNRGIACYIITHVIPDSQPPPSPPPHPARRASLADRSVSGDSEEQRTTIIFHLSSFTFVRCCSCLLSERAVKGPQRKHRVQQVSPNTCIPAVFDSYFAV